MSKADLREAGFTLLEVLVALAVFGFLLAGLAQGTQFGLRAWATQSRGIEAHADLDAADRTLRLLVGSMAPGSANEPPNIVGDAHRLAFSTALPAAAALQSREADAVLLAEARPPRLVLRWTPRLHAVRLGPPPPPQDAELLPGVQRIDLSYWRPDGAGGWLPAWSGHEPPALVRIHLVFADARHWPDIVVAPMRGGTGD